MSNKDKVHLLENQHQHRVFEYQEEDPNFQGSPLDDRIKEGPLNDRGCKDVFFVFLYFLLWGAMGYIGYYAVQNGEPNKLLSPFDINNNHCGYGITKDYPYIYILDVDNFYCVTQCPETDKIPLTCYNCSVPVLYPSDRILTLCYPKPEVAQEIINQIADLINLQGSEKFFADLVTTKYAIAGSGIIALIVSLLLTYLLKWFTNCIVWSMIIIYHILMAGIGTIAFYQSRDEFFTNYKFIENNDWLLTIAYTFWILAGFSLLLTFCLCKKIKLAIAVLKAAADFMQDVFQVIFVPVFMFVFIVLFFAFWIVMSVYIYSSGNITRDEHTPFFAIKWDDKNGPFLLIYLFGLFWNIELSIAFCQFVISSACCMWYFSHMGASLSSPICRSFGRGLCHHLGSILFGSLILAVVQIIKLILEQIHKAMKETIVSNNGVVQDNALMKCGFSCCKCIIKYFERFIRFLNQNAYIMIALTGQSFCEAAYDAFYLITRNVLKVAVTHGLGRVFEFIGTLFIASFTTTICYLIITEIPYFSDDLLSPIAPTLAFIIIGYAVGSLFMNLYGIGTDTILLCYLADYELHRDQGGAKSMPSTLKEFLHDYY